MTRERNYLLAVFATAAASLLGLILARSMPSAVFPEITFNRAIVLVNSSDLPPKQMLVAVTRPLEEAAYGVIGVKLVRSTTTRGSAEIDVYFAENADPTATYQLLDAALSEARNRLPADTTIDTRLLTTGSFPIIDLSISSPVRSLASLTDVALYDLAPSFHRIPGVYRVELVGAKYREYVVRLNPVLMRSYGLSPQQVVAGLAKANVIASAGRVMDSHRMMLTVVTANLHQASQLLSVPIAEVGGQPVLVRNIGTVELGIREDYIRAVSQNGPSVLVGISRQPGGDTVAIASRVRALVSQFRKRYPDVRFSLSYDQSALVTQSMRSVRDAILLGLALAVAVVFAFTLSPLSALVAALVVPCTVAATLAVMYGAGMTFNMMTLGGMAAGIGLFIDDAIAMVEGIHRMRAGGEVAARAVERALKELRRPLVAATLTVVVAFAPLVFLSGITGLFFRALAVTLGTGLLISLVLALYFTPALELIFERWRRQARGPGILLRATNRAYALMLRPFARFPALALLAAMGCVVGAYALYRAVGTDYLPALDEGAFVLDYITPPQSTLHDTNVLLGKIQHILASTPEVVAFARRTGTQLGFFLTESNRGDISVLLTSNRSRSIYQVIDSVRRRILENVPGVQIEFSQILQDLIGDLSGTPEPIEVKVFGANQKTIEATARRIAAILRRTPGLVDVLSGIVLSSPEEEVLVNETAAERYGISAADIRAALHVVVEGTVATQLRVGDRLYGVRVRYPKLFHEDLRALSQVMLKSPDGGDVPLSEVTTLRYLGLPAELDRERLRPVVHVTARISGVDLGTAMARVRQRLAGFRLAPGVSIEYGGLYKEQQKAFHQLSMVLIAGIVAMFLVLLWEFGRLGPALAVLIAAVSCLAGSFIGLHLTGITLNISSFMGIIMVAGITAKNGILLLDHAERDVARGIGPRAALMEAAQIRLRPIIMTTLATAAGLAPLAIGLGAGAKVQQPLAVAVIGGLAFALILSTPLAGGLYLLTSRRRALRAPQS